MVTYLTDNEKRECKKVVNAVIDMWLAKVLERMAKGQSFEDALNGVREEMLND